MMTYDHIPSWIKSELERFDKLIEYINDFLTDQASLAEDAEQAALTAHTGESSSESFMDYFSASMANNEVAEAFPSIIWASLFLSLYGFLENTLDQLTQYLAKKEGSEKVKPNDLKHRGIHRSQIYHKKVLNISFPDQNEAWINIKDYNKVRNSLIHAYGRVPTHNNGNNLRGIVDKTPGISLKMDHWNEEQLVLTHEFVRQVFKDVVVILKALTEIYP